MAESGDYVVASACLDPPSLLEAHIEIGMSRFAFGPEELEDWTEEQLSQSLSSGIRQLMLKLRPHKLEDRILRYVNGKRRKVATWILHRDSIQLLFRYIPLWPDDEDNRRLNWHFFKSRGPASYLTHSRALVLFLATQQQVSILEARGMHCQPRSASGLSGIFFSSFGLPGVDLEAPPSGTWSVWDERDATPYFNHPPPRWSPAFPRILQWWKSSHDAILARQIAEKQWKWRLDFKEIVANTPSNVIAEFKTQKDEPCVWYNLLAWFAEWRAVELGLDKDVKLWPTWRKCAVCDMVFHESSARVERLGLDQIDICTPCLIPLISSGSSSMSKEGVLEYLRALAEAVGRVPVSDFGRQQEALIGLSTQKRVAVLKLLSERPSLQLIERHFGSWFAALVASGVLADGARQGTFGTECLAKDGHRCLSLAEKTIDDFLTAEGVAHQKEVPYPDGKYRADFGVPGALIEYFGLQGREDYALKTRTKIELCRSVGMRLIEIYPEDLVHDSKLRKKLGPILSER